MLKNALKTIIESLVKLPSNKILDKFIYILLDFAPGGLIRTRNRFYMYFKKTKSRYATGLRKLFVLGKYEESDLAVSSKILQHGDWVIDGGAQEGYFSMFFSRIVGQNGGVLSIEPNKENIWYLRKNIEGNQVKNVIVVEKAIDEKSGTENFYYNEDGGAWGSMIETNNPQAEKTSIVETDTLDKIAAEHGVIDMIRLIKLDIQGKEMPAILGAEKIIANSRPFVFFEVCLTFWAQADVSIDALFDYLKNKKYKLFVVKDNKRIKPYVWLESRIMNILAIHESKSQEVLDKNIVDES